MYHLQEDITKKTRSAFLKITHQGRDLEVQRFRKLRSKLDFVSITDPYFSQGRRPSWIEVRLGTYRSLLDASKLILEASVLAVQKCSSQWVYNIQMHFIHKVTKKSRLSYFHVVRPMKTKCLMSYASMLSYITCPLKPLS